MIAVLGRARHVVVIVVVVVAVGDVVVVVVVVVDHVLPLGGQQIGNNSIGGVDIEEKLDSVFASLKDRAVDWQHFLRRVRRNRRRRKRKRKRRRKRRRRRGRKRTNTKVEIPGLH